jgi:hypothetical protein
MKEKLQKSQVFLSGLNGAKSSHVKIANEDNVITLFSIKGTVHFEFIPKGQTANQTCHVEIL